jgi:hypothetical protein
VNASILGNVDSDSPFVSADVFCFGSQSPRMVVRSWRFFDGRVDLTKRARYTAADPARSDGVPKHCLLLQWYTSARGTNVNVAYATPSQVCTARLMASM